jgi:hypothetical protein
VLEGDYECELDRLPALVARSRPGRAIRDVLEQRVGVGLEPERLDPLCRLRRVNHGWCLLGAARPGTQRIQAAVGRDPVKPVAHGRAALELREAPPSGQQRLLDHVLCVLHRAEDPIAVHLQLAPQGLGELAKRLLVAGARSRKLGFVCGHRQ